MTVGGGKAEDVQCERCGEVSSDALDACPSCGWEEAVTVGCWVPGKVPWPEKVSGDIAEEARVITEEDRRSARAAVVGGGSVEDVTAIVQEEDVRSSTALRTERDLDLAVQEVKRLKGAYFVSDHRLGRKIGFIHAQQLWKLRTEADKSGKRKARWSSFEAFCNDELGITPQHARRMMDTAANFTEAQVEAHGARKLSMVLQVAPERRSELLQKVAEGVSQEVLAQEVRRASSEGQGRALPTANPRVSKMNEAKAAKRAAAPRDEAPSKVTVAAVIGTQNVPLFVRPKKLPKDAAGWRELKARAKRFADQPVGRVELANDVVMLFALQESARGEWHLRVTTVREEAVEAKKGR
jgi:predicted  nucleic acid-binding Zn-ribbon protein